MIDDFADRVAKRSVKAGYAFDPASILAVVAVITQVIAMLKDCKLNSQQALRRVRSPGFLDRLRLRDACKKAGLKVKLQDPGIAALLDEAQELTTSEVSAMMKEAQR